MKKLILASATVVMAISLSSCDNAGGSGRPLPSRWAGDCSDDFREKKPMPRGQDDFRSKKYMRGSDCERMRDCENPRQNDRGF